MAPQIVGINTKFNERKKELILKKCHFSGFHSEKIEIFSDFPVKIVSLYKFFCNDRTVN